jgi:hypothetical protein
MLFAAVGVAGLIVGLAAGRNRYVEAKVIEAD